MNEAEMPLGYEPICYHCVVQKIGNDAKTFAEYCVVTSKRDAQTCKLCKRWTLEGLGAKTSFIRLHDPLLRMKLVTKKEG